MSGVIRDAIEDIQFEPEPIRIEDKNADDFFEHEEEFTDLKRKVYTCDLCGIKVTSSNVLRRHKEGRKHIMRVEREGKTFECQLCDIIANSQSQLDAHLKSSRHKNRLYKKENAHVLMHKGIWIILFCVACVFLNLLLLFKTVLN